MTLGTPGSSDAPWQLLDEVPAEQRCETLIIGCGNVLRGDDAVGPVLIRTLFEQGVPEGVRLADGGTAGLDVAFTMRGAGRVILVDACRTGAEPGTIYRVPAHEVTELPPLDGINTHAFRWDHALAFSTWLLGPQRPSDIIVYLIEAADVSANQPLSPAVSAAMAEVIERIRLELRPLMPLDAQVELTDDGYVRIPATLAERWFPGGTAIPQRDGAHLLLVPLHNSASGGTMLKIRNSAGDRSILVLGQLPEPFAPGVKTVAWEPTLHALLVQHVARYEAPATPAPTSPAPSSGGDHARG
ncbi:hydrogenase maturation protease [Micrococcales bacterium 31B]|nr:hydrogenase maturation protease [Micrococcales bacterium 31B]